MGSEDFSFFQRVVPGLFFFLGVVPEGQDPQDVAPNHSPRFFIDEKSLQVGVRALANVACDFLEAQARGALKPAAAPAQRRSLGSGRRGAYQMPRRERSSTPARPATAMRRLSRRISQPL